MSGLSGWTKRPNIPAKNRYGDETGMATNFFCMLRLTVRRYHGIGGSFQDQNQPQNQTRYQEDRLTWFVDPFNVFPAKRSYSYSAPACSKSQPFFHLFSYLLPTKDTEVQYHILSQSDIKRTGQPGWFDDPLHPPCYIRTLILKLVRDNSRCPDLIFIIYQMRFWNS